MNSWSIKWILPVAIILLGAGIYYLIQTGTAASPAIKKGAVNPCGKSLPKAIGYTNDFIHLFTAKQIKTLDSVIGLHEQQTTNQVAIITIDSTMPGKCTVEEYTLAIANEWGVGTKEKNNGVVIGIAPGLKNICIQNGYGIEKVLGNEETRNIIDSFFIPEFKNGNYFKGTENGLIEIIRRLN